MQDHGTLEQDLGKFNEESRAELERIDRGVWRDPRYCTGDPAQFTARGNADRRHRDFENVPIRKRLPGPRCPACDSGSYRILADGTHVCSHKGCRRRWKPRRKRSA